MSIRDEEWFDEATKLFGVVIDADAKQALRGSQEQAYGRLVKQLRDENSTIPQFRAKVFTGKYPNMAETLYNLYTSAIADTNLPPLAKLKLEKLNLGNEAGKTASKKQAERYQQTIFNEANVSGQAGGQEGFTPAGTGPSQPGGAPSGQGQIPGTNQAGRPGVIYNAGGGAIPTVIGRDPLTGDVVLSGPNRVDTAKGTLREMMAVAAPSDVVPTEMESMQGSTLFETWSWVPDLNADGLGPPSNNPLKILNQQVENIRFAPSDLPYPRDFNAPLYQNGIRTPYFQASTSDITSKLAMELLDSPLADLRAQDAVIQAELASRDSVFYPGDIRMADNPQDLPHLDHVKTNYESIYGPRNLGRAMALRPELQPTMDSDLEYPYRNARHDPYIDFVQS